jgi:hypothetical protein
MLSKSNVDHASSLAIKHLLGIAGYFEHLVYRIL